MSEAIVAMDNISWRKFLTTARHILGEGAGNPLMSQSWCAFTTFTSLDHGVFYFNRGFPEISDCEETCVLDGSVWSQKISYDDLAHIIVPAVFYWESVQDGLFSSGYKDQAIDFLSQELTMLNIPHRLTTRVLEIKLY